MSWELVTALPHGGASRTILARREGQFAVLRTAESEPDLTPFTAQSAVLPLHEVAVVAGTRYAVYDVVSGLTLQEVLESFDAAGQAPPVSVVCTVVLEAARGLASTQPPKAHGGLSDATLLIGRDGQTRVMDFGAPRLGRFALGLRPSAQGDVFALAAVLHSALTGFTGNYADAVTEGLPLPPPATTNSEVGPVLDDVIMRAVKRDPARRQRDLAQFADELEAAVREQLVSPAQIANALGPMLENRHEWLEGVLAAGSGSTTTAPVLGIVAPERTMAHAVPWVTGQTAHELAATVDADNTTPDVEHLEPEVRRAMMEAALAATVVRSAPSLKTIPAWGPIEPPTVGDGPTTVAPPPVAPSPSAPRRAPDTLPTLPPVTSNSASTLMDEGEALGTEDPNATLMGLPALREEVDEEWQRAQETARRRARGQERIATAPLPQPAGAPAVPPSFETAPARRSPVAAVVVATVALLVAGALGVWFLMPELFGEATPSATPMKARAQPVAPVVEPVAPEVKPDEGTVPEVDAGALESGPDGGTAEPELKAVKPKKPAAKKKRR